MKRSFLLVLILIFCIEENEGVIIKRYRYGTTLLIPEKTEKRDRSSQSCSRDGVKNLTSYNPDIISAQGAAPDSENEGTELDASSNASKIKKLVRELQKVGSTSDTEYYGDIGTPTEKKKRLSRSKMSSALVSVRDKREYKSKYSTNKSKDKKSEPTVDKKKPKNPVATAVNSNPDRNTTVTNSTDSTNDTNIVIAPASTETSASVDPAPISIPPLVLTETETDNTSTRDSVPVNVGIVTGPSSHETYDYNETTEISDDSVSDNDVDPNNDDSVENNDINNDMPNDISTLDNNSDENNINVNVTPNISIDPKNTKDPKEPKEPKDSLDPKDVKAASLNEPVSLIPSTLLSGILSSSPSAEAAGSYDHDGGNVDDTEHKKEILAVLQKALIYMAGVAILSILLYSVYYVNLIRRIYAKKVSDYKKARRSDTLSAVNE